LYRKAYDIVIKKRGEALYEKVIEFEEDWLGTNIKAQIAAFLTPDLLSSISTASTVERRTSGERFLKALKQQWQDHDTCICMLGDVTMYLVGNEWAWNYTDAVKDRIYCIDNSKPSIYAAGMQLFRDTILKAPSGSLLPNSQTVLAVCVETMLDHIQMEREGDSIDKSMLKGCARMLESMYIGHIETDDQRLYDSCFEPVFLQRSKEFYAAEGERMMRDSDAGTYCRKTKRRMTEEQDRCRATLSESTLAGIDKVVAEELITNKLKELIEMETGVAFMIANDRIGEIASIYELSARVDGEKTELRRALHKRIVHLGTEVNEAALSPAGEGTAMNQATMSALKWVEQVLDLKDKFDRIWDKALQKDPTLQAAIARAFSEFINHSRFNRASEYVSLFIDDNMKKGIKDKTDAEVDVVLDKAIILLRYINDKDMFERYYKKHLSRRLLMQKSISTDVEKQMTGKMKLELGNAFTSRIEAMFKDMTLSEELTAGYKTHSATVNQGVDDSSKSVDLNIHVLTAMTWPQDVLNNSNEDDLAARGHVIYPAEINRVKDSFTAFYNTKYHGRKLFWQPGMGTADLKARFPGPTKERVHELNVSTYAMVILLLFNDLPAGEFLSTVDIHARTNIPRHDLDRNLQSLAVAPKTRILRKEPMSKDIKDADKFCFNEKFQSKFTRVKVGTIASANKAESDRERLRTEKKNDENRQFVCEAAIVRIMK
jgi:cullin 3